MNRQGIFSIVFCISVVFGSHAAAGPVTADGLTVFVTFEEGAGGKSDDMTGNGHDAELVGTAWGSGYVTVNSSGDMARIQSHADLCGSSFTYDLWFEAGSTAGNGRILNQTGDVAGTGPDVLERSSHVAIRINDSGAVFNVPTIGTRSNSGPPDHWGTSEETFHRNGGPEHLIITHDAGSKTVNMFLGLEGQPLKHTFEATYQGSYNVSGQPLALGNISTGERYFAGNFYQFAYYGHPLSFVTDGSRNVTGGEVYDNHLAGSNADLPPAGGISTSPSGHYMTYDGRPILLAGDSGTQCVMQNANLNHREWIDDCAERGINAVHIWSFMAVRQRQDGSTVETRWGYVLPDMTPWARQSGGPNAKDQKPRWDLFTFDEGPDGDFTHYWPRLRDLCSYAKSKGMLVGITVFFGGAKDNWAEGYHPFFEANGGPAGVNSDCEIVEIDSPGTEILNQNWSDGWSRQKKIQWLWENYSQKLIDETLGIGNVFYVFMDEHSYCNSQQQGTGAHFRDFFQSRGAYWADWSQVAGIDMVYDQRLLSTSSDDNLEAQFGRTPYRPFIGLEEGSTGGFNYTTDLLYMVWKYLIEGGNYFHHNDARMETDTTGVMVYDPNSTPFGRKDMVRLRMTWVGAAARFFNNVENLDAMSPNDGLVSRGDCLANPGREYLVYQDDGGSFTLDLSGAAGTFTVKQFNCRTGESAVQGAVEGGGTVSISAPDNDHWAFHVYPSVAGPQADAGGDQRVHLGDEAIFDGSGSSHDDGTIAAWAWDFGDGRTGGGEVARHTYAATGRYLATLTVTDEEGNTASDTASVLVFIQPQDLGLADTWTSSGKAYVWDILEEGKAQYIDRAYTFGDVPDAYEGLLYLKTANDDKTLEADPLITFELGVDATVYIAYDRRLDPLAPWLLGWTGTGDRLVAHGDSIFDLYARDFTLGSVDLGPNTCADPSECSMYTVVLRGEEISMPDGGDPDGGGPDGGSDAGGDFGTDAGGDTGGDAGPDGGGGDDGPAVEGCGCIASHSPGGSRGTIWLLVLLLWLVAGRRRRHRTLTRLTDLPTR